MESTSIHNPTTPTGCCFLSCFGAMKTPCSSLKNLVSKIPYATTVCEKTKYSVTVIKNSVCEFFYNIYHFVLKHLNLVDSKPPITSDEQVKRAINKLCEINYDFPLHCCVYLQLSNGSDDTYSFIGNLTVKGSEKRKEFVQNKLKELQQYFKNPPADKLYAEMNVFSKGHKLPSGQPTFNWDQTASSCDKSGLVTLPSPPHDRKNDITILFDSVLQTRFSDHNIRDELYALLENLQG